MVSGEGVSLRLHDSCLHLAIRDGAGWVLVNVGSGHHVGSRSMISGEYVSPGLARFQ